jgi:hypothetical protein
MADYTNNSQNTYQSIIGYDVNPLQGKTSNYLKAYLMSKGLNDQASAGKYLEGLGYAPTQTKGGYDIDNWARQYLDNNPNTSSQLLNRIGLGTDQAKLDFIQKGIAPASGVTAEMRATDPAVAAAQYQKIDPAQPPSNAGAITSGIQSPYFPTNTPTSGNTSNASAMVSGADASLQAMEKYQQDFAKQEQTRLQTNQKETQSMLSKLIGNTTSPADARTAAQQQTGIVPPK